MREDPRCREQEWGNFQNSHSMGRILAEREVVGRFFYRFENGESGADVFDRVSSFMESLFREIDTQQPVQNIVIVSHGLFVRLFLMRFFRWTVEKFHAIWNLHNCEHIILEKHPATGSYELKTELRMNSRQTTAAAQPATQDQHQHHHQLQQQHSTQGNEEDGTCDSKADVTQSEDPTSVVAASSEGAQARSFSPLLRSPLAAAGQAAPEAGDGGVRRCSPSSSSSSSSGTSGASGVDLIEEIEEHESKRKNERQVEKEAAAAAEEAAWRQASPANLRTPSSSPPPPPPLFGSQIAIVAKCASPVVAVRSNGVAVSSAWTASPESSSAAGARSLRISDVAAGPAKSLSPPGAAAGASSSSSSSCRLYPLSAPGHRSIPSPLLELEGVYDSSFALPDDATPTPIAISSLLGGARTPATPHTSAVARMAQMAMRAVELVPTSTPMPGVKEAAKWAHHTAHHSPGAAASATAAASAAAAAALVQVRVANEQDEWPTTARAAADDDEQDEPPPDDDTDAFSPQPPSLPSTPMLVQRRSMRIGQPAT